MVEGKQIKHSRQGCAGIDEVTGWQATLDLQFKYEADRSFLAFRQHQGPLRVQRPFYPQGPTEACHIYLLHPPGGVVGGDNLVINVDVAERAHALITTPAAAKFYRSGGQFASQQQHLTVGNVASLEWLPQENIVFSGAKVNVVTRVNLGIDARFIGWDISCLGRAPSAEPYSAGQYNTRFEVWRDDQPLFIERSSIVGGDEILNARWGLAGYSVIGTLFCAGDYLGLVDSVRAQTKQVDGLLDNDAMFGVTQLSAGLVCRYLGHHGEDAKTYFSKVIECISPVVMGCKFHRPRIWET